MRLRGGPYPPHAEYQPNTERDRRDRRPETLARRPQRCAPTRSTHSRVTIRGACVDAWGGRSSEPTNGLTTMSMRPRRRPNGVKRRVRREAGGESGYERTVAIRVPDGTRAGASVRDAIGV